MKLLLLLIIKQWKIFTIIINLIYDQKNNNQIDGLFIGFRWRLL